MAKGQKRMAKMTTPEIRQSTIKGFLRLQKKQGGVRPTKIQPNELILIETKQYIYQIKLIETQIGRRYTIDTASPVCRRNPICIDIRSHYSKLKYEMSDWIGKNMRMILKFTNGVSIMTSDVTGASILGSKEDGTEYKYEIWSDTEVH